MSDEAALLRAICEHPDEDTPRLAYADWLDENRPAKPIKPAKSAKRARKKSAVAQSPNPRAEFIRQQIELAGLKEDSPRRREVAFRCRQLLDAHEEEWLDPRDRFAWDWAWSRGFVEMFTTHPYDLADGDTELFETYPFRRLCVRELANHVKDLEMIPANNKLRALDLIGSNLDTNQLKKFAKMKHLPHLRELGLMFNALRDSAVKVLCGEAFFQKLELIRLGANPFTERAREQLQKHFGDRVTFAHEREPERLYTVQDDRLTVGWGKDFTQYMVMGGFEQVQVAFFDHAGNLLRVDERAVKQPKGADDRTRFTNLDRVRDKWLKELGYKSGAVIKVKAFRFPTGEGITPFNWWAETYDPTHPQHGELNDAVQQWLEDGQYRFDFVGDDNWFDRDGEVTDT